MESQPTDENGTILSVLIIDDEVDLAEVLQMAFEDRGMKVYLATNGKLGLEALEKVSPDAIITDMMMPVLDGAGFLIEYKKRPFPKPPVVVISGFHQFLSRARELGAVDVIQKPYQIRDVVSQVKRLAEDYRSTYHLGL